ncbi:AlpA family phage regulatory protein [Pseudomonadales bacterium]|nr:AlpA family phage regulatory protein [Pseudomonadales bacterium]
MQAKSFIRPKAAAAKAGISLSHLYALVAANKFPQPVKISERITAFVESECDDWIVDKIKAARSKEVQ